MSAVLACLAKLARRQLVRAACGTLLLNACSKGLMLLSAVLLARVLGTAGYGIYAATLAIVMLLSVLGSLGLPTLLVRMVSVYQAGGEWSLMRGLVGCAHRLILGVNLAVAALGALIVWILGERLAPDQAAALWCAMPLLPLMAFGAARSGALRGLHHVVLAQIPECVVMPVLFVATLLLAWAAIPEVLSPGTAMALRVGGSLGACVVGTWFLLRRFPAAAKASPPAYAAGTWARSAAPLFLLGAMSVMSIQTDVVMLAALRGAESAGVFHAAARAAEVVAFSLMVGNLAIQPSIARLYKCGDLAGLQSVVTLTARAMVAFALPIALALGIFAGPVLRMVFGPEFERAALCLGILCAAQVFNAALGSADQILNMTGHERDTALGMMAAAVSNVMLNAALIPLMDIEGAAVATALTLVIWNVTLRAMVRRRLGIESAAFGRPRSGHPSLA